jgi:hypothetical protein
MNAQEFINVITTEVLDLAIVGTKKRLERPAGRALAREIVEMLEWYNNLTDQDKEIAININKKSTRDAVFSFLCALDGSVAIEDADKGVLELFYVRRDERTLLNEPHKAPLHELM